MAGSAVDGINATAVRFGHPDTLVAEARHWLVLLRPEQPTLGSLVLVARGEATAFGDLAPSAFAELATVVPAIERMLQVTVKPDKLNYLMLMMVDPHVHFHVIPRYAGTRALNGTGGAGLEIADTGWPKAPQLSPAVTLEEPGRDALLALLRDAWA